jgi:hypothetical protein
MHPTTYICVHTAQRTQASPTGCSEGASPTGCLPTKQTKSQNKAIHIHSKPFTARPKPDLSPSAEGQPRVSRGSAEGQSHSSEHAAAAARPRPREARHSLMVRVGATPRHRLRATAGAAHRHPSPRNGLGRPATTSPKEEAAPAHKPRRGHTARRGTPEKRQGSKVPGRAPPCSPPPKAVEGLEGRPRFLIDGARLA